MGSAICVHLNDRMVSIKVISLFLSLAMASAQTVIPLVNKIDVVYVRVADCDGCGMTDGQISLKVCGKGDADGVESECCQTGFLENGEDHVFARGQVATFKGSDLGQCEGFDMSQTYADDLSMEITHSGNDMGKFEWVRVMVDAGRYQCKFNESLDESDSEEGKNCSFLPWV